MAKRYHRPIVWLSSVLLSTTALILIQLWWRYDYLDSTTLQVEHRNQPYFKEILVHIPRADARSFGSVSRHDPRYLSYEHAQRISPIDIRNSLVPLLSSFFQVMNHLGLKEAWIIGDVLLGHHFGHHLLPWRLNLEIQVSESMIRQLVHGRYHNTSHNVWFPPADLQRNQSSIIHQGLGTYILDLNPYWLLTSMESTTKKIEAVARWVDTRNGKFIDLRVLPQNSQTKQLDASQGSVLQISTVFPLRISQIEGISVRVPKASENILEREYGRGILIRNEIHGHHFDKSLQKWLME